MSTAKTPVITINREYGAGGRTLAALLSEKLQIPYYDRDVISKTVEESGFDQADVEREGEELSMPSKIFDDLMGGTVPYNSSHDRIFEAEKKVVLELAEKPCIIVGRCANSILKESGIDNISIYLHAPFEKKIQRTIELGENGDMKPEKYMEKRDEQRSNFYKQYTGGEISDAANYTFCFDTGKVSIPLCADMIVSLLQDKND